MRGELNEQLSALVDDELRPEESALLLRQLARSEALSARFGRYCLISEALHRNLSAATGHDLVERIACVLDDEPSHGEVRPRQAGMFLRPVAGMALAVAGAMAVVALWPQGTQDSASGNLRQVAVQESSVRSLRPIEAVDTPSVVLETASAPRQWRRLDPRVQQRLTDYLINHSERSANDQMDTALPYMRIIGHESKQ